MPWVTAFSTSGCRRSGGTRHVSVASSIRGAKVRRAPNRIFSMARRSAARASSSERGTRSRAPRARLRRRNSPRRTHIFRASSGRLPMRALIELRLLKRKWGWIWARRARSSVSRERIWKRRASVSARRESSRATSR
jgi:hypothetical protein